MAIKYLKADALPALLEALAKNARVVAPFNRDGVVQFEPWQPGKDVELKVLLAKQSPKEYVFLQTETYLKFGYETVLPAEGEKGPDGAPALPHESIQVEPLNEAPAQVIFGLRPCDARGFAQMDRVMGGYGGFYYDPLYNKRRQATTLVAVTCVEPRSTCFCTAIGGCPAGHEGVDVLCTKVEGGCVVESFSEKGEALLATAAANGAALADATDAQKAQADETKMVATTKVDVPFTLDGVRDGLHDSIEDKRWHDLAMRCISCGTCTYVCPNCYCFSVNDEIVETKGERYRCWDNCFNPQYTEETSGHNARAEKAKRFRNRFSHKFWYYPDKYDSLLCSGCGRCIVHCPTRIDIREVVRVMGGNEGAPKAAPGAECAAAAGASAAAEAKEA